MNFLKLFNIQRSIVGTCPRSKQFFRLSDCRLLVRGGRQDWLDQLEQEQHKLEVAEARLSDREHFMRVKARKQGRKLASRLVRRIDPIFHPRGLDAQDAKVMFHPIDYLVFHKLSETDQVKKLCFLDRKAKANRPLQRSIERVVAQGKVEWATFRVNEDGKVKCES